MSSLSPIVLPENSDKLDTFFKNVKEHNENLVWSQPYYRRIEYKTFIQTPKGCFEYRPPLYKVIIQEWIDKLQGLPRSRGIPMFEYWKYGKRLG